MTESEIRRVRVFYDELAPSFDRIHADWNATVQRESLPLGLRARFITADMRRLPFRTEAFDAVISADTRCRICSPRLRFGRPWPRWRA